MSTTPAGLGELHGIHQQLRDLRQRQEQGGVDETDVARLEVELRNAEQQLPDNIRHAYERSVESRGPDAMCGCRRRVVRRLLPNAHTQPVQRSKVRQNGFL